MKRYTRLPKPVIAALSRTVSVNRAIPYPDLRLLAHAIGWAGIGLLIGLLLGGAMVAGVCG